MALPVTTDTFTTSSPDKALATYSANYSVATGGFTVSETGDYVRPANASALSLAYWNADTFADNQYAEMNVAHDSTIYQAMGCAVRVSNAAATGYGVLCNGAWNGTNEHKARIVKVVAGSLTELGARFTNPTTGQLVRIEVDGSTTTEIRVYYDGALQTSRTDSSSPITSGYAGLIGQGTGVNARGDNWTAGNLASGPTLAPTLLAPRQFTAFGSASQRFT